MDLKLERAKLRLWQGLKYLKGCPGDPCGRIPQVLTMESQNSWMEALRKEVLLNRENDFHMARGGSFTVFFLDHQIVVFILEHLKGKDFKKIKT